MTKYIHGSDVHEDYDALSALANFAQAKNADKIIISGDLNLKGYGKSDIERFTETRNRDAFRQAVIDQTTRIYTEFKRILDASGIPYFVIPGNYDTVAIDAVYGDHNLDHKLLEEDGIKHFGYGGGRQTPAHIANLEDLFSGSPLIARFDDKELYALLCQHEPTIAVTHQPPHCSLDYTVFQQHWGTPVTRRYLEEAVHAPKLLLVGHVHESGPNGNNQKGFKGIDKIKETVIVNSGNLGRFDLIDSRSMEAITDKVLCRGRDPMTVPATDKILDWGTFAEIDTDNDGTVKSVTFYSLKSPDKKKVDLIKQIARHELK